MSQAIATGIGYAVFTDPAQRFLYIGGMLVGIFISPDMDVDNGNISNYYMRRLGWFVAFLWRVLWWPYGRLFKHRGLSHVPVLGTLTRLIYVGIPIAFILWLFGIDFPLWIWPAIVGLMTSDLGHSLADWAKLPYGQKGE